MVSQIVNTRNHNKGNLREILLAVNTGDRVEFAPEPVLLNILLLQRFTTVTTGKKDHVDSDGNLVTVTRNVKPTW